MPSKHLSTALNVLSDIVKNPLFNEKEMEKERKVIFEEIKMRKDDPQIYVFDKIQSCLYRGTLAVPLSGTYETMDYIDRKKITAKFNQLYHPNNLILCVVGDASFDEIVKFAKQNFPAKKGTVPKIEIGLKNEEKIETRKGIEQANLVFAYHTPLATDKRHYAALALNTLMAVGLSSRLFAEIREKRNLAYSIRGDSSITKDYAYNAIYIGTMKQNVEIVKKLILEEFSKVAKELTEKELKQVKEQLIGRYKIFMEDSRLQMLNLLSYEIDGCVEDYYAFEKNISEIKLQDVKNLAGLKDYSFFALVPEQD
jgi:predicted Zn-dependent peptidase